MSNIRTTATCPRCGERIPLEKLPLHLTRCKVEMPPVVKRFLTVEGNCEVVRLPSIAWLSWEAYYDKETGRMRRYGEEITAEDIKRAKRWLKASGFRWDPRLSAWVRERKG